MPIELKKRMEKQAKRWNVTETSLMLEAVERHLDLIEKSKLEPKDHAA
jgi:predicted DNA-binding protein